MISGFAAEHRVLCGDATSAEVVCALLGAAKPALMVTDPPYGVDYDPNWRERAGLGRQRQTGTVANDEQVDWSAAYGCFLGTSHTFGMPACMPPKSRPGLESAGFRIRVADHLGQTAFRAEPRRLSLAA